MGSPPRGRGRLKALNGIQSGLGITPAWAGKAATGSRGGAESRDHPRVGGEGNVPGHPTRAFHGITPAWAGKAPDLEAIQPSTRDHPRVGGEGRHAGRSMSEPTGSPPRGRGRLAHELARRPRRGITPAWAGKASTRGRSAHEHRDHPRVGGEGTVSGLLGCDTEGSPPRGRGRLAGNQNRDIRSGITPAWAGKARFQSLRNSESRDHPRVGGEGIRGEPGR